ncbi:hypothetical protein VMCG_03285 [Cytospora schulzeri]|uniref:Uncharacterized protein n=1 Tax=Cytospora schulzeri TaxID=448051 RepID=A0A423WXN6_9PEZI|nr:hypothetical protein VMCG_03285 [Valsa malicola]
MPPSTLEQFIRFGTDAAGIERILRMVQAVITVILSQPFLTNNFELLVAHGYKCIWEGLRVPEAGALVKTDIPDASALVKLETQQQPKPPAETWLDLFARTFNGMYLLLEALTLLDTTGVPLWGPHLSRTLHVEGQRFWLLALACGLAAGLTRTVKLLAYAPVPPTGEGYGTGEKRDEKKEKAVGAMADWERERERLRRLMWPRREQRRLWRANVKGKLNGLVRRCVADFLDMAAPARVVGWLDVDGGTVAMVQIVTTYLTGREIWERCGRDLAKM